MKKAVVFIIIFVLVLIFSGCSAKNPEIESPEISATLENNETFEPEENLPWNRNIEEHWKVGENGEKLETSAHELGEDKICHVCKSFVAVYSEGSAEIIDFDEHSNPVHRTIYNSNGAVRLETFTEYEYDEYGNAIFEKTYPNTEYTKTDRDISIHSYTVKNEYDKDSDGKFHLIKRTVTSGDGMFVEEKYEESLITSTSYFDAEGKILTEVSYNYSTDESGNRYLSEQIEHDCLYGTKYFYGYNAKGDLLYLEELDENGETVCKETFEHD